MSAQVSAHPSTGPGQVEQLGAVDLAGELLDVIALEAAPGACKLPSSPPAMALQVL